MAQERKCFIGGNWKCNQTQSSVTSLVNLLNSSDWDTNRLDVVIAPISLHIPYVKEHLKKEYEISSQNVSATSCGAFTGEVAADQLKDYGINWTLVGHSERRTYYHESDDVVATKTKMALSKGLKVILCIGETLEERQANTTLDVVYRQLEAVAKVIEEKNWTDLVIAYEPVWAIGTGVVATPQEAQEVHQKLRNWIETNISPEVANTTRIIYGGSVKGNNCHDLIALNDIDGFLVGGASLTKDFLDILQCVH